MQPRILVTAAAGHTGSAVVMELLAKGFPVRAFVRRRDGRSDRLERAGAEILVGDLFDIRDVRAALVDVQRAYYCLPFAPNLLHGSMLFAIAAEEARLEVMAVLGAWNPHSTHPSIHQREHWLAHQLQQWMPTVDTVYLNPGLFAFPYFLGLPAVVHFGLLMLPFGQGRNAPPANEDIAAVAAEVLAHPSEHIGRTYRPTGPALLSGTDVAEAMGNILDRRVRYIDVSTRMFIKAARALGMTNFQVAQVRHYAEEVRQGAFEIAAPNNHIELVCSRPAESFETTARRYLQQPQLVDPRLKTERYWDAVIFLLKTIVTAAPDLDRWESDRGYPRIRAGELAHESNEWLTAVGQNSIRPSGSATTSAIAYPYPATGSTTAFR